MSPAAEDLQKHYKIINVICYNFWPSSWLAKFNNGDCENYTNYSLNSHFA